MKWLYTKLLSSVCRTKKKKNDIAASLLQSLLIELDWNGIAKKRVHRKRDTASGEEIKRRVLLPLLLKEPMNA